MNSILKFCLSLASLLFFGATANAQVANGGFETPSLGAGNFAYQPSGASWSFSGNAGISNVNSGFTSGAPEVPAGQQVAFLQTNGSMQQTVYLVPSSILSFHATQRVNYGGVQTLKVLVNGGVQAFVLGTRQGNSISTASITPPAHYYETYAVKLTSVTRAGYYTLTIEAATTGVDATAFIDSVALTTTSAHAYGLWDQGISLGTWRTDYPISTNVPSYGPCIFTSWNYTYFNTSIEENAIVTAGGTPYGNGLQGLPPTATYGVPGKPASPCYGVAGGPSYPNYPQSDWQASPTYVAGNAHWIVDDNYETVAIASSCTPVGPPNQSRPLVTPGNVGPAISVNAVTTQTDPSIGNYNVVSLITNDPQGDNAFGCIPYVGYGVSATHGNVQPIAIMDAAGHYRPHLSFHESVFQADGKVAVSWLVMSLSGWNDNYKRVISISLGKSDAASNLTPPLDNETQWWNWNIQNSYYYPGGVFRFTSIQELNSKCNLGLPALSFTITYVGSNGSPSSISAYNIDLYSLVHCVAGMIDNNAAKGWLNPQGAAQLPDPIVVSQLNWALEGADDSSLQDWIAFWNPQIQ
jgi:hypothetical protein